MPATGFIGRGTRTRECRLQIVWFRRRGTSPPPGDDAALLLSAQRALLGNVGPNVLAVYVAWSDDQLRFHAYVDEDATADEREALSVAATEMIADFPDVADIDEMTFSAVDRSGPGCSGGHWAFLRLDVQLRLRE